MNTALRVGIASALVAVSVGVPCILHHRAQLDRHARQDAGEQEASRLAVLIEENERLSNLVVQSKSSPPLTAEQLRELLRLRNERHSLAAQTNLLTQLTTTTSTQARQSTAESETAVSAEMTEAMQRILPALPLALKRYTLAHSNQLPGSFVELGDYFPSVAGRKMAGLRTFEFVREGGPKAGDALVLRGNAGRRPGDDAQMRVYGFSDGRVVQVSSEDGRFEQWEGQHLNLPLAGAEEKVFLESEGTSHERARIADLGASLGISAEDTGRFFDRVRQQQKGLGEKFEGMQKSLTGSPEERQAQMRAAMASELNALATETLGDKGPALVQKLMERQ